MIVGAQVTEPNRQVLRYLIDAAANVNITGTESPQSCLLVQPDMHSLLKMHQQFKSYHK